MTNVISGTKYKFIKGESKFRVKKLLIIIGADEKKAINEITNVLEK